MKLKTILASWEDLIGKPRDQPLEVRIFHAVCILSLISISVGLPVNYMLGLKKLGTIMLVLGILLSFCYYLSRYRKNNPVYVTLYGILSNLLLIITCYYNSGSLGPVLIILVASIFLLIVIVPPKQYAFWILLNISIASSFLFIEYKDPSLIAYTYSSRSSRYMDLFISYVCIVLVIFSVTRYIRHSYNVEKKLAEQKALELETSNETKNKLLSIIAHDLRSPLDLIQNYLEVLGTTDFTSREKQRIEKDLLEQTQNTGQMLLNLLSWTRAQMSGVNVNLERMNLLESLQQTILIQQEIGEKKGITIINHLTHTSEVVADPDMLQLVIRNLLNNAIKFTSSGGTIHIATTIVNEQIIISIKDNGIAISLDKQKDIFSLKAKSTYGTKKEKGIGLGLILCKEFAELQNESIWFESIPDKGTTFFISVPSVIVADSAKCLLTV